MLGTLFKGVYNRIKDLETNVNYLFERNGKIVEGFHKGINEIQSLISHMYRGDDHTRPDKILGAILWHWRLSWRRTSSILLEQIIIRGIAQNLSSANDDQISAIRVRELKAKLFSVQPQDGKAKFETTEGKDHRSLKMGWYFPHYAHSRLIPWTCFLTPIHKYQVFQILWDQQKVWMNLASSNHLQVALQVQ